MDKLIVNGLGPRLDGEYPCDIRATIIPGGPEFLTYAEGRRIKQLVGLRGGEIAEAFVAGDMDLELALAIVLLARHGKTLDEALVLDSPPGSKIQFEYGDVEEDEDSPPAEPATTPETDKPSTSGGESTTLILAHSASDPSPTGLPDSPMSATSGQAT